MSVGIDYVAMAHAQNCDEVQSYKTAITNLTFSDAPVCDSGPVLLCDVSTGVPRPVVPDYRRHYLIKHFKNFVINALLLNLVVFISTDMDIV